MDQRFRRYRSDRDLRRCGVYDSAGGYRSRWYQGFDDGMEWLRLSLEGVSGVKVWVFAIDQPPGIWDDSLEPVLVGDGADFSLYGVRGRYLCFTAAPAEGLVGYTLTFPGRSIDAGLPFVLRDDAALRQFLAVYQSAYMDVNQEAARFPGRLDPHSLTPLPDLGLWVGAASWMGETAGLPDLLAAASKINRMRGTRRGLDLLIKLVTGGCGELVEDFQWRNQTLNKAEREDCTRLYGGGHASVTLLLPVDTAPSAVAFLERILDDFIPLGETYRVLQFRDGAELDGHFYLDVNTQLQEPPPASMNESDLDELVLE